MILTKFYCACGYGPFEVEDNRDAPIPNPPVSVYDENGEGQAVMACPRCDEELPTFVRP